MEFKFLGAWHFVEFAPWGAFVPHLTLADFGPRDPDKKVFVRGDRPHLGKIWDLAGLHFGPLFLKICSTDFGIFKKIDSTYSLLAILRFKKSEMRNSNKFRSKLEKNAKSDFFGCQICA